MMKAESDRVCWGRAWSLFYKLFVMKTDAGIASWLFFTGALSSIFHKQILIAVEIYQK